YILLIIGTIDSTFVSKRKDRPAFLVLRPTFYCEVLPGAVRVLLPLVREAQPLLELVLLARLRGLGLLRRSRPLPHWCRHCLRHIAHLLLVHLRLVHRIVLSRTRSCTLRTCYAATRCVPASP